MKKTIILSLIVLLFSACSSESLQLSKLQNRDGIYFQINESDPFSGSIHEKFNNGQKKIQGQLEDGLKDGIWTTWYESSQKKSEGEYSNNLKEGKWVYWEANGKEKGNATFVKGKRDETTENGKSSISLEEEIINDKGSEEPVLLDQLKSRLLNGNLRKTLNKVPYTGPVKDIYSNGKIKLKGQYFEGLRTGEWTYYLKNGDVKNIKNF